jgi:hypothetical protein
MTSGIRIQILLASKEAKADVHEGQPVLHSYTPQAAATQRLESGQENPIECK